MTAGASETAAVILAAGKGTRMRSETPKVLHEIGGAPMIAHALAAVRAAGASRRVVVVGHGADQVRAAVARLDPEAICVVQEPQNGTGHAVRQAEAALAGVAGTVFTLYADVPLIRAETLTELAERRRAAGAGLAVLGFEAADPTGYGRLILRDGESGGAPRLARIVEQKDATPRERETTLCNSGVFCADGARLFDWLARVQPNNAQGEYYLTDAPAIAAEDGAETVVSVCPEAEVLGVNSRAQLAEAEAAFQAARRRDALAAGATLVAPETVFFSADTQLEPDVIVEPNVIFGPGVRVRSGARIRAFSHLEGAEVGANAVVGPYARLRPGTVLGAAARVGNFVEIKNAGLGAGAKANHLTYIGDASVGAEANIGAGVITCNYDGVNKHRTEIGERAFIGSNAALVAPVAVGDGAIVGAGSVVTETAPENALVVARARQTTRPGLAARLREALQAEKAEKAGAKRSEDER